MTTEYTTLTPQELAELRSKEARGELTPEDTLRFILSTRAKFLSRPVEARTARAATPKAGPAPKDVDFF